LKKEFQKKILSMPKTQRLKMFLEKLDTTSFKK